MGLIPNPPGRVVAGSAIFEDEDILRYSRASKEMYSIRGDKISMIFQEPMTSLNPAMTIGKQMSEVLIEHKGDDKKTAFNKCVDMLKQVGIPDPQQRANDYPHQLSGGMRQRVMFVM
jgi:ABC-type dipeptide/oligopeptide/nickel transport system ATPase component